jgi:hypothetical protein
MDPGSRKTLVILLATLSAIYPNFDFSSVLPSQFQREKDLNVVSLAVDSNMVGFVIFCYRFNLFEKCD